MDTIKDKILEKLETFTELKEVFEEDYKKDPLSYDIASYPVAFVGNGTIINNDYSDNTSIEMSYSFPISVLMKPENFTTHREVEKLMFKIAFEFSKDYTLSNTCTWIRPTTSDPVPFTHKNRQLLSFDIRLEVRNIVPII